MKISIDQINRIEELINQANRIAVVTHYNPDGDAIGSALGLHLFLKKLQKQSVVIVPNDFPDFLSNTPGVEDVVVYFHHTHKVSRILQNTDLLFCVDFNGLSRLENMQPEVEKLDCNIVMIDHHPEPEDFPTLTISNTKAAAAAELVYELIKNIDDSIIDKNIAENLYMGVMTDTGSFGFNSVTGDTYKIAGELLEKGIDKEKIYDSVYNNFNLQRMRLLGYCLNKKMKVFEEYGAGYISLTQKELKEFGFQPGDTEGFVNYPLAVKGIVFTALFIEKDDFVKISLRSKGCFPANKVASEHFVGGGHRNAAGAKNFDSIENTVKKFEELLPLYKDELKKAMK